MLGRDVKRLRIKRREDNGEGPLPALLERARGLDREKSWIRLDVANLTGAAIVAGDQGALAARIKHVWVCRTWRNVTALAAAHGVHFAAASAGLLTLDTNRAVVLLRAANLIRKIF